VAELWGVLEGLKYTRTLGFSDVELNIDSVTVVNNIRRLLRDRLGGAHFSFLPES
jgi:ribonuclease HI